MAIDLAASPHAARSVAPPTGVPATIGRAPRRRVDRMAFGIGVAGLLASLAIGLTVNAVGTVTSAAGVETFLGRVAALAGTYLLLVMVLLTGRLPLLERSLGQDRLIAWHRRLSPYPLSLLALHGVLITLGYAAADHVNVFAETGSLIAHYPDVLAAIVGFAILVAVAVSSIRRARRRLGEETWWSIHLYTYLALSLSFAHQFANGASFISSLGDRIYWALLWGSTAGVVIVARIALPLWRSLRHRVRVVGVREEAPGVVSIVLSGRRLERLRVEGGQYFGWRFLTAGLWWRAHPYSLSAVPIPPYLRITVKGAGRTSEMLGEVPIGTRVAIEGPYGTFTDRVRRSDHAVFFAGGIGVTPIRAIVETLPPGVRATLIVRARRSEDLLFRSELERCLAGREHRIIELVGTRHDHLLGANDVGRLVPDLADSDVYACGPEGFTRHIEQVALALGTPKGSVHRESFSY